MAPSLAEKIASVGEFMNLLRASLLSAVLIVTLCAGCGGDDHSGSGAGSSVTGSGATGGASGSGSSGGGSSGGTGSEGGSGSTGGTGSTGNTGTTPSSLPGNPDTNLTALTNAFAAIDHSDPTAEASAMLAAAQALPDVQDAGLSDSTTVWIVYNALSVSYTRLQLANPVASIRSGLSAQGYEVDTTNYADPTALRNVKQAMVFTWILTAAPVTSSTQPRNSARASTKSQQL
jgi:hypothetical protein